MERLLRMQLHVTICGRVIKILTLSMTHLCYSDLLLLLLFIYSSLQIRERSFETQYTQTLIKIGNYRSHKRHPAEGTTLLHFLILVLVVFNK